MRQGGFVEDRPQSPEEAPGSTSKSGSEGSRSRGVFEGCDQRGGF
jgi:hypothetical protein